MVKVVLIRSTTLLDHWPEFVFVLILRCMAMGKKRTRDRQASMWVATADLPKSAGHPFYARLNRVLDDAGFDTFVEAQGIVPPAVDLRERRLVL